MKRFLSEEQIQARVAALARRINRDYAGREVILIGVLKGAFVFLADLSRRMKNPVKIDFVRAASYGTGTCSSGKVKLTKEPELSLAVGKSGSHLLTRNISLVEALSLAGGLHGGKGDKTVGTGIVIIVRARPGEKSDQPRLPNQATPKEQQTVSLSKALAGDPQHNVEIRNGDTIFVPTLTYYATGEVKKPGSYPYEEGMTVLIAVTTAGGFTDKASQRRIKIIRQEDNVKREVRVKLEDPIRPGDTLVVPESWF